MTNNKNKAKMLTKINSNCKNKNIKHVLAKKNNMQILISIQQGIPLIFK